MAPVWVAKEEGSFNATGFANLCGITAGILTEGYP